jgi:hypothetical protein
MPRYLIERQVQGAHDLSSEDLVSLARTWNEAVESLGVPYTWVSSFVAGERIICVHDAEDDEAVREHARRIGFTASVITEVRHEFGPETAHQVTGPRTSVGP